MNFCNFSIIAFVQPFFFNLMFFPNEFSKIFGIGLILKIIWRILWKCWNAGTDRSENQEICFLFTTFKLLLKTKGSFKLSKLASTLNYRNKPSRSKIYIEFASFWVQSHNFLSIFKEDSLIVSSKTFENPWFSAGKHKKASVSHGYQWDQ